MGVNVNLDKEAVQEIRKWAKEKSFFITLFIGILLFLLTFFKEEVKRYVGIVPKKVEVPKISPKEKQRQDSIRIVKKRIKVLKIMSEQKAIKRDVNHELDKVCIRWDADYAAINLFSNGDTTFTGVHFSKMSRMFEGRKKNNITLSHNIKAWSTDPFDDEIDFLEEHQVIYYKKLDDASLYIKKVLTYYNFKSVIYVAYMEYGYIAGYMSIEFKRETNFTEEEKEAMMKELHSVKTLLGEFNINKVKLENIQDE